MSHAHTRFYEGQTEKRPSEEGGSQGTELRLSPTYSLLSCEALCSLHWRMRFNLLQGEGSFPKNWVHICVLNLIVRTLKKQSSDIHL